MGRGRLGYVLGILALLLLFCVGKAKKSRRWTYPRPQWPVPPHRMDPEPCRLFIWDAGSAVRFCQCSRLLVSTAATSLWEDSHRQLWLRIPYTSPLLNLFPCQQHSLSRCAKCGHEYREHVRWASERRKDQPFDKLLQKTALTRHTPVDYRGVFTGGAGKKTGGIFGTRKGGGTRYSDEEDDDDSDAPSKRGGIDWKRYLAAVTEAQRTTLLQLSGISVTSAAARAAFSEVRASENLAAKKRERDAGKKNKDGGSRRAGDESSGRRRRRVRGSNGGGGGGGRYGVEAGGSETEQQVADRNLRAFDQMNFVRG